MVGELAGFPVCCLVGLFVICVLPLETTTAQLLDSRSFQNVLDVSHVSDGRLAPQTLDVPVHYWVHLLTTELAYSDQEGKQQSAWEPILKVVTWSDSTSCQLHNT